jgi:hypothetical protein
MSSYFQLQSHIRYVIERVEARRAELLAQDREQSGEPMSAQVAAVEPEPAPAPTGEPAVGGAADTT